MVSGDAEQGRRLPCPTGGVFRARQSHGSDYAPRRRRDETGRAVHACQSQDNPKPATPLHEAIAVPGLPTLSTKTANSYLDMFRRFWDWAEKHGRAPEKLFVDLKVKASKKNDDGRKAFTPAQTKRLFKELTENTSGLVKSDDYKWATLLTLYTGARRREIAQLFLTDIRQEGDIWFIDINDDGKGRASSHLPLSAKCPSIPS